MVSSVLGYCCGSLLEAVFYLAIYALIVYTILFNSILRSMYLRWSNPFICYISFFEPHKFHNWSILILLLYII